MRLSFGQEFKQEQRTILTQRMIQSMEILQLPLQQLEERIEYDGKAEFSINEMNGF